MKKLTAEVLTAVLVLGLVIAALAIHDPGIGW